MKSFHQLVDVTCQRTISGRFGNPERILHINGNGVPGDGQSYNPDPQVRNHLDRHLIKPIFEILTRYPEVSGLPTPRVALEFAPDNSQQNSGHPEQVQEQVSAPGELNLESAVCTPTHTINQLVFDHKTGKRFQEALLLAQKSDLLRKWGIASSGAIILEGDPGTGKTAGANAMADALGKNILALNYGQLESRYVGQTSQNIRQAFALAEKCDALLFIDEADSAVSTRLASVSDSAGQGINTARNTILVEIEKFSGIVVLATNNVKVFDPAIASRILDCISFSLPDLESRKKLFKVHLPKQFPLSSDVNLDVLAEVTEGFSGREIRNVIKKAAVKALAQNCPDSSKQASMSHFLEATTQIRESRNLILHSRDIHKDKGLMEQRIEESIFPNAVQDSAA
jgi:AAA+ superfamily predicted ATPase